LSFVALAKKEGQKAEDGRQMTEGGKTEDENKSKACPEPSRMGQKSKCKITTQKLALSAVEWVRIPRLAVVPLGGRPVATVYSTVVENSLALPQVQIAPILCKTKPIFVRLKLT